MPVHPFPPKDILDCILLPLTIIARSSFSMNERHLGLRAASQPRVEVDNPP